MSSHTVRVNNFIKVNDRLPFDWLSKVFIAIQWPLGLNRIGVLYKNTILNVLSTMYALFFTSTLASLMYLDSSQNLMNFDCYLQILKFIQYLLCVILCYISRNKLRQYYEVLYKFDAEIKYKPKVNRVSILIFICMISLCTISILPFIGPEKAKYIPFHVIQTIENHYCGFLLNLLNQRLQIINNRIESSVNNPKFDTNSVNIDNNGKKNDIAMNKLMDLYYIIINAYDLLTDGIKWQLLFIITTSFTCTLIYSYHATLEILSGENSKWKNSIILTWRLVLMASESISLIVPCTCCDKIRYEVRRLRELLATKLFENALDKTDRSVARALLALTKARNLSFSLLRMVDISISLPFSILSLIATYLIIMLQFEKVINPTSRQHILLSNSSRFQ